MNYTIRSKGHDVLVRGPGRRVRITREWTSVSDVVFDRVKAEAGNLIEVMGETLSVPVQVDVSEASAAPAPLPDPEPEAPDEDSEEVAETPPSPSPSGAGGSKKSRGGRKSGSSRS